MDEATTSVSKKTTRTKKTAVVSDVSPAASVVINSQSLATSKFEDVIAKISQNKQEFDNLQKEITLTKQDWIRDQIQQELERKREQETYLYNTSLARKRAEDEFQDEKLAWEKDLAQRKQELEDQKIELERLRKLSEGFDKEKEQLVKEAQELLGKQLTEKFNQEKTLREQEVKSEKDLLNMKISNLETDNSRLNKEIEVLKRSLDEATRQVKEIAVKVIESGSNQIKPQISSQE